MREFAKEAYIWSPMPEGSGAIVVHRQLADRVPGYVLRSFDSRRELFPPLLLSLRNPRAKIVHATPDHAAMLASSGQKLVITFHNFVLDRDMQKHSNALQRLHYRTDLAWLTRRAMRRASAITAVSRFTARQVEAFFGLEHSSIRVISNGIDVDAFTPGKRVTRGQFRVLVAGNASRRKGTHLLSAIASRLAPGIEIACTLTPVELRRWVGELSNVRAVGKQPYEAMPNLYQQSDLLLMPTAREGFGLAVVEAMACGLPVVAADTSTMPELVSEGEGGYLCALDDPASFAERINKLALDPQRCAMMGEFNRRKVVAHFSDEAMIASYSRLFEEVERSGSIR